MPRSGNATNACNVNNNGNPNNWNTSNANRVPLRFLRKPDRVDLSKAAQVEGRRLYTFGR